MEGIGCTSDLQTTDGSKTLVTDWQYFESFVLQLMWSENFHPSLTISFLTDLGGKS